MTDPAPPPATPWPEPPHAGSDGGSPQTRESSFTLPTCLDALERSLRDPLRTIEGVGAAIAAARSPEQQRHLLRAVNQAALMIERSSDCVIDLLRCQHGVLEPQPSAFTVRSFLHEVRIAAHGPHTRARSIIELQFPEHEAVIIADRRRLVRITATLLALVWVADEEGGALTLTAALRASEERVAEVEIRVGLPFNSKEPRAIADIFRQPRPIGPLASSEELEGYSASVLAQRLGVGVSAAEVPRSVLIRFTCPLVAIRTRAAATTPVVSDRPVPILLFDTPSHTLRPLEPQLRESGYQPIRAHHRDDAIGILFQHAPSAMLAAADASSDAPLQFARHVRSTSRAPNIPIVLVARDLSSSQLALARRCVDSVLVSPVSTPDAIRHLNGCLSAERRSQRRELELY